MGERKETRMETRMEWKKNLYGLTAGQCELPAREYGEMEWKTKTFMVSQLDNVSFPQGNMERKKTTTMEWKQKPTLSHSWSM